MISLSMRNYNTFGEVGRTGLLDRRRHLISICGIVSMLLVVTGAAVYFATSSSNTVVAVPQTLSGHSLSAQQNHLPSKVATLPTVAPLAYLSGFSKASIVIVVAVLGSLLSLAAILIYAIMAANRAAPENDALLGPLEPMAIDDDGQDGTKIDWKPIIGTGVLIVVAVVVVVIWNVLPKRQSTTDSTVGKITTALPATAVDAVDEMTPLVGKPVLAGDHNESPLGDVAVETVTKVGKETPVTKVGKEAPVTKVEKETSTGRFGIKSSESLQLYEELVAEYNALYDQFMSGKDDNPAKYKPLDFIYDFERMICDKEPIRQFSFGPRVPMKGYHSMMIWMCMFGRIDDPTKKHLKIARTELLGNTDYTKAHHSAFSIIYDAHERAVLGETEMLISLINDMRQLRELRETEEIKNIEQLYVHYIEGVWSKHFVKST